MFTSRIALIAAITSLVAWAAKAVAIGLAGGLDRSPLESPLFVLGLLAQVVAVFALALAFTSNRPPAARVTAVLAAPVAVVACVSVIGLIVERVQPADPSWVWAEVNLWVVAPLVLGLAMLARRPAYHPARPGRGVATIP